MKKFLIVFIVLFWFVSVASAGKLITGAFGINLGEALDQSLVQDEIIDRVFYGGKTAGVRPKFPNRLFNEYRVILTPTTKIVVEINAYAHPKSCSESEYVGLEEILKGKYGKPLGKRYHKIWTDGTGRTITYTCDNKYSEIYTVTISYKGSTKETVKIVKERKKLIIEASDPSGL
jgi:hypothetical protein